MAKFENRKHKFANAILRGAKDFEAAIEAGSSPGNAARTALRLRKDETVKFLLSAARGQASVSLGIEKEQMVSEFYTIFANLGIDTRDRIAAGTQVNKMLGFYATEKREINHSGAVSCVVMLPDNNRLKIKQEENI